MGRRRKVTDPDAWGLQNEERGCWYVSWLWAFHYASPGAITHSGPHVLQGAPYIRLARTYMYPASKASYVVSPPTSAIAPTQFRATVLRSHARHGLKAGIAPDCVRPLGNAGTSDSEPDCKVLPHPDPRARVNPNLVPQLRAKECLVSSILTSGRLTQYQYGRT